MKHPQVLNLWALVVAISTSSTDLAASSEPALCSWGRGNYTVRDRDFRYTRYFDGGEELYAHRDDPDEWTNLADRPELADIKAHLAAFLPQTEAPLVTKAITGVRAILSADEPTPRLLNKTLLRSANGPE